MSGMVNKVKAKVDGVLHKDGTHGTTGTHTTGTHTTGTGVGSTGYSDPTGPHDSHLANKADPRVDSDRYGTAGNTAGAGGVGAGQYGSSTGTHGTTGTGLTGTHGTHGTTGTGLTGTHGTHGTTGTGLTGTHGTTGHSDPTGPHDSHMANKLDPRVDSDRYGTAGNTAGAGGVGAGQYGSSTGTHGTTGGLTGHSTTGTHGTHGTHGTSGYSDPTGPHDSHMANKLDPRVDSDRYGTAGNTAGAGGVGAGQYGSSTGTHGTTGGIGSTTAGTYDDGTLPKALTEDVSRAEPHSSVHGHQHGAGTTVHGKPKLTDKLNPKKDADGDGKAGFMD